MPEYDPTHPPQPVADDLTPIEVGRDPLTPNERGAWPTPHWMVPDPYAGPVPSREFETAGLGSHLRARPVPAVPPPPDAPAPEKSIAPPPGHTAQP